MLTTYVVAMHHHMEYRHGYMQEACRVVLVHDPLAAPLLAPWVVPLLAP